MTFPRFVTLILIVAATCGLLAITTSGGGNSDRAGSVSVAPRTRTSSTPTVEPVTTTLAPEPPVPTLEVARVQPPAIEQNTSGGSCANPVIPEAVARRESGCRWDAYNPTGCSGRGCIGFYQLDEGHFAAVSPWNPNVSGVCHDLQGVEWEPWAQTECASRLGPGAWN